MELGTPANEYLLDSPFTVKLAVLSLIYASASFGSPNVPFEMIQLSEEEKSPFIIHWLESVISAES